jgi:hypothetical protein
MELEQEAELTRVVGCGPRVVRVKTDRNENVAVHRALHDAVAAVLR